MIETAEQTERRIIMVVPESEWHSIEHIFADEWNATLPDPAHAQILAEMDGSELIAFCMAEELIRVGNFYVAPNHRGTEGFAAVRRLIERVKESAERAGRSVIGIADEERFEALFMRLGMRRVGGAVYRKDYFDLEDK